MGREMKHTEIGDIPADWEVQTFEETFRVLTNNTLSRADLNDSEGTIRNIHYGDILTRYSEVLDCDNEDIPFLNSSALLTAAAMPLQDGDVILADTAEDETVGKATEIYGLGEKKMVAGLHTIPCRVKKGDFAAKWLGYYMNSQAYHDQVLPYITGIKVSSISKSAIAETLVLMPPRKEQEAIVAALSDIDVLITNMEKLIAKKRAIKQGAVQKLLTGKDRIEGYERSAWVEKALSDVGCFLKIAVNPEEHLQEMFWEYSMPAYDDGQSPRYVLGNSMSSMRLCIKAPVLLFNKLNVRQKRVWYIVECKENSVCSTEFLPFVSDTMDLYFLRELLLSDKVTADFEGMSTGTSNSQKRISPNSFLEYKVFIPEEKKEQEKIAEILKDMSDEIKILYVQIDKLKTIKQGMMSELLTGKIRLV